MKKVLATSWHPGGVRAIAPVIKKLNQDEKVEVVALGYEHSEKIFASKDIPYKTLHDYGLFNISLNSMEHVVHVESPDLILTGQDCKDVEHPQVLAQTLTLAGKSNGIPTISVSDFWTGRLQYYTENGEFKYLSDYITAIDELQKDILVKEGFPEERLVITGNPNFDGLDEQAKTFTNADKETIRKKINLESEILLFYAAGSFKGEKDELGYWDLDNIRLINEVLMDLPEKQASLVAKLHPRVPEEDLNEITEYINTHAEERVRLTDIGPIEMALTSDVTLTSFSTVGIEAIYMGKPCISIQPGLIREDFYLFLQEGDIIPIRYTTEDCKALVRRAIIDIDYRERELLEKSSGFRTDGKATERVTDLVYDMLELDTS